VLSALLVLGGVLIGSVPTGVLVARARGIDLRKVGSGNIGATNVGRALGKRWAIAVLLADAAKGYAPVLVARRLEPQPWLWAAVALATVLGHSFSLFLRGRGGKGVATSLGAALALAPVPALAAFGVYVVLYAIFRISSVGSLAGVTAFPIMIALLGPAEPALIAFGASAALLVIVRHKDNIKRLARGEELKAP
jgi:acyl phosphate:glycerol-3-phosphate acyltransferase